MFFQTLCAKQSSKTKLQTIWVKRLKSALRNVKKWIKNVGETDPLVFTANPKKNHIFKGNCGFFWTNFLLLSTNHNLNVFERNKNMK